MSGSIRKQPGEALMVCQGRGEFPESGTSPIVENHGGADGQ